MHEQLLRQQQLHTFNRFGLQCKISIIPLKYPRLGSYLHEQLLRQKQLHAIPSRGSINDLVSDAEYHQSTTTYVSSANIFYFFIQEMMAENPATCALSSRRAKRAGWPKGLKGPEGAFRPFGPVGVLRRRLLHRNGNFVPLAP